VIVNVRSGLGLGETYYAWIVASFSIGEFFSALAFGVLAKYLKIKTLMLTATFSLLLGSLLYGIGAAGEMLIVGRILQGVHFGGGSALLRIYIGETSNIAVKLKGEDKAKSQIKNTNFFLTFSLATLGVSVGPGSAAIVVQFSSIDQFRWSGWLLVTTCLFELVIIAIYFVELPTDINRKGSQLSLKSLKPAIPLYVSFCDTVQVKYSGTSFIQLRLFFMKCVG
jgi:MFS family permease